jgi:hypothetical protein
MSKHKKSKHKNGNGHEKTFLWGITEIARALDRTPRSTYHLAEIGALRSIRKVAGRWVASRNALIREMTGEA